MGNKSTVALQRCFSVGRMAISILCPKCSFWRRRPPPAPMIDSCTMSVRIQGLMLGQILREPKSDRVLPVRQGLRLTPHAASSNAFRARNAPGSLGASGLLPEG